MITLCICDLPFKTFNPFFCIMMYLFMDMDLWSLSDYYLGSWEKCSKSDFLYWLTCVYFIKHVTAVWILLLPNLLYKLVIYITLYCYRSVPIQLTPFYFRLNLDLVCHSCSFFPYLFDLQNFKECYKFYLYILCSEVIVV